MNKQNKRRLLPNLTWAPERYFMTLQFILLSFTLLYLLYLIFGTIGSVRGTITQAGGVELDPVFDRIHYLLLIRVIVLFTVVLLVDLLLGLFFLHRVTGPLVRIKAVL